MRKYIQTDEWNIIEEGFHRDNLQISESIFSLGNGRFGQRGNFEERYSGESYRGAFVAGITYLDNTRVGWWKNGFPKFYTRIANAANWSRIDLRLIDEELDLAQWDVNAFRRRLDMKEGISYRDMQVVSPRGNELAVRVEHLNNMAHPDLCMVKYSVTSVNYSGKVSLVPTLDGNIKEAQEMGDSPKIWNILRAGVSSSCAYLWTQTRREDAQVCYGMAYQAYRNGKEITNAPIRIDKEKQTGYSIGCDVKPGDRLTVIVYTAITSSLYYERHKLVEKSVEEALEARRKGWDRLVEQHKRIWKEIWEENDVTIEGDPEAQQGIRFCIFQLYQTHRGEDARLNIAPKGFTGEKYGGNTYWNTELCCIPFFLMASPHEVVRNLLMYRYNQLPKAIENARKLGFTDGAALYPQVTSNGEECHNEWEITFEEIHRNNIIVYAMVQHAEWTGDTEFIARYGLEEMIAICRFWDQRVSFSEPKQKYVILGVTGPNGYENNVDNNWYTNYSCMQVLKFTLYYIDLIAREYPEEYERIRQATRFDRERECARWRDIIANLYLPEDRERGIFVQNDGYLDKELKSVDCIPPEQRPINQHWSWDRILRSCYVKQSDVLLGLHLYSYAFDTETIRRNFNFYEPMTVHESSLSPYIHAIVAARIGELDKAYRHFLHATRLDLDDYNNETAQGLHITSMGGSWLALVNGFAGAESRDGVLQLRPSLPGQWKSYSFRLNYRERTLDVRIGDGKVSVALIDGEEMVIGVYGKEYRITEERQEIPMETPAV